MKYHVEIAFIIEAESLGEATGKLQKLKNQNRGLPQRFALSILPADGRMMKRTMARLAAAAYRQGREEHREYRDKFDELERLMDANPAAGTPEGERLSELAVEIDEYEQINYPIGRPPGKGRP